MVYLDEWIGITITQVGQIQVLLLSDPLHVLSVVLDEWHWTVTSEVELINATSCICGMIEIPNPFKLMLFLQFC